MSAPRFVILQHDYPSLHFDLMLEEAESLRTWRLPTPPQAGITIKGEVSFPHRLAYLDYEGPVGGGRGQVLCWDRGIYTVVSASDALVEVHCQGQKLRGTLYLLHRAGNDWDVTYTPDA